MKPLRDWSPLRVAVATTLLVYLAFGALGSVTGQGWGDHYDLISQGRKVQATIFSVDMSNHASCRFRYQVNGSWYEGEENLCGERGVGGTLELTYLPRRPALAVTDDPENAFVMSLLGPLVIAVIAGAVVGSRRIKESDGAMPAVPLGESGTGDYEAGLGIIRWCYYVAMGGFALFLISALVAFFMPSDLAQTFALGALIGLAIFVMALLGAANAPCPRCGKPFNSSNGTRLATGRACVHCGLALYGKKHDGL